MKLIRTLFCISLWLALCGAIPAGAPGVRTASRATPLASSPAAATLQSLVITNVQPPSSCDAAVANPLPSVTSFQPTDPQAYIWYYVKGASKGDVFANQYYAPNGQLYAQASGPFQPLDSDGNWCFPDKFPIAGTATATMTGTWTVKITYNGAAFGNATFTIGAGGTTTGPTLVKFMMTNAKPSVCDINNPPQAVTSFLTTDTQAYLWFYVKGVNAGDVASSQYYTPAWTLYPPASGPWDPSPDAGNKCFTDSPLTIAGATPATLPGPWTVKVTFNNAPLFTLTFTIAQPTSGACTYTLGQSSQSFPAGGGNGSVSVTAGNGCTWAATAGASWITITSGASGSGNGTVNFSVAANTGTSSRSAAITIAGKTYTVTQAGAPVQCTFTVSPLSDSVPASGGTRNISVTSATGCSWTAASSASWLTIKSGATGSGNGTVTYSAAANTDSSARNASLSVADKTVVVTEAGVATSLGILTTLAGTDWSFTGDGGPALSAPLGDVSDLAIDAAGNVYVADATNYIIVKITPDGTLQVVAGNGIRGFSGDGGNATSASLSDPSDVRVDADGNLYIADSSNNRVRMVTPDGIINTIAGDGKTGFSGDGGPAVNAAVEFPYRLAIDSRKNLYMTTVNRVRMVTPDGTISTVAGNGDDRYAGDGGPATAASMSSAEGVAVDPAGNIYITSWNDNRVRKVGLDGTITTIAGTGDYKYAGDGGPATQASLKSPNAVALDGAGNVYIADVNSYRIRVITPDGNINTFAGNDNLAFSGDGGPATQASLYFPRGVSADAAGNVYIADTYNLRVRRVAPDGTIRTIAGNGGFRRFDNGTPATQAYLFRPQGIRFDTRGNLYIADTVGQYVWKVTPDGSISKVAGVGVNGCCRNGGPATNALIDSPTDIALDAAGNLYIADAGNSLIRKVGPDGTISTFAGTGDSGWSGDGGPAINAELDYPRALSFDAAGNLYIADSDASVVRRITPGGIISTVAGNGTSGFSGDGSPAVSAALNGPWGIVVDGAGNILIADSGNHRVRKITPDGVIRTIAGNGKSGFSGDGGPATAANLFFPDRLAMSPAGELFVADTYNNRVRKIAADGTISTVVGNGNGGFAGDGGPALSATLNLPLGLTFDPAGALLIADRGNDRVRVTVNALPSFDASPSSLTFKAGSSSQPTTAQAVSLTGSLTGLQFTTSIATKDGGNWLRVSPAGGALPATAQISADPTGLAAGTYTAVVTFLAPLGLSRSVSVSFTLDDPNPPKLGYEPSDVSLSVVQGGRAEQAVWVTNQGGGALAFTASAGGSPWLSVASQAGSATATDPASVTLVADTSGLDPGTYNANVTVASTTTTESLTIPVTATVTAVKRPKLLVSQTALAFRAALNGGDWDQAVGVLNIGDGVMSWTASASSDRNWLTITPSSGSSDVTSPNIPFIRASVNVAGLAVGDYSGRITVSAPGADSGSQSIDVKLTIVRDGSELGPSIRPTGLIYTALPGAPPTGSQDVTVLNLSTQPTTFNAFLGPKDAESWFQFNPAQGNLSELQKHDRNVSAVVKVQPITAATGPVVREGTLTFKFAHNINGNVNLLMFVPAGTGGSSSARGERAAAAGCTPNTLYPLFTQIQPEFRAIAGKAFSLDLQIADSCGNPVTAGTVVATFSSSDPAVSLVSLRDGRWTGTWIPRDASYSRVGIQVRVQQAGTGLSGLAELSGNLSPN